MLVNIRYIILLTLRRNNKLVLPAMLAMPN